MGKQRARTVVQGGRVHSYTPPRTRDYEADIARAFQAVNRWRDPASGPVRISVKAVMPIPASWPRYKRVAAADGRIVPQTKPDADNVLKSVLDALNGAAYRDDKQVIACGITKIYGICPRLEIEIEEVDENGLEQQH